MDSAEPTFSIRLVRPFVGVLRACPQIPAAPLDELSARSPDERMSVGVVVQLLEAAVAASGDTDLGLRAANAIALGDFDVLEYAAASCDTWGEAIRMILRYLPLVSDAADYTLKVNDGRALLLFRNTVPLPRVSEDFQAGAFTRAFRAYLGDALPQDVEIWFTYPPPTDRGIYDQTFGPNVLRFDAPVSAMRFDAAYLDRSLSSSNPKLHAILRRAADRMLADLPHAETMTERVRKLAVDALAGGNTKIDHISERLGMSRRTLFRHLKGEGTTYKDLLDQARHHLALRYLETTRLGMHEVSFLLGFSDPAAFCRAFKRWTGKSPGEHRLITRARRALS